MTNRTNFQKFILAYVGEGISLSVCGRLKAV